jgi:cytochrome c-type biogenesis protein CcmH/NrfF
MPSWILWLSPVIIAPLLAVLWTVWAARPRGPVQALKTVPEYDRFRAALTNPVPEPRRAGRSKDRVR